MNRIIRVAAVLAVVMGLGLGSPSHSSAVEETALCGGVHGASKAMNTINPTTGDVLGITIIIEFPDLAGGIDFADIEAYLNEPGYTGHTNNGSVRDYFYEVSGGALNYTNTLIPVSYVAPQDWSYYANASFSVMNQLATAAIEFVRDTVGFDFSGYDANGDGVVDAINIFTEGGIVPGRALHPHFSEQIYVQANGLLINHYQTSNMGNSLPLGTFCHENGHQLGGWPDLYDSPYSSPVGLIGRLGLMGLPPASRNPAHPNGYFKILAGWSTPERLDGDFLKLKAASGMNQTYKIPHPDPMVVDEFYIFENRQDTGRDEFIYENGIALYHIGSHASGDDQFLVVQADADDNMLTYGNLFSSPESPEIDRSTTPAAYWGDGTFCGFALRNISASGPVMSFDFDRVPMVDGRVVINPGLLDAPWSLTGTGGFTLSGTGTTDISLPLGGVYTVTFDEVPYWPAPSPASQTQDLSGPIHENPVTFKTTYASPFSVFAKGDIADSFGGTATCIVDYDGDGRDDIFAANGSKNQLLLNDETGGYINIAPSALATMGGVKQAAWADYDNNGLLDVFLVRADGQHKLMENSKGFLKDVTADSPDLLSITEAASASWSDVDRDGFLDLFVVRTASPNQLFMGSATGVFTLGDAGNAANGTQALYAAWGDVNDDGYTDVFRSSAIVATNALSRNNAGSLGGYGHSILGARDARWGDLNNDGLLDLVAAGDGFPLYVYIQNSYGHLVRMSVTSGDNAGSSSVSLADFDNDGWLDIFLGRAGNDDLLLINEGEFVPGPGGFGESLLTTAVPLALQQSLGATVATSILDHNEDGTIDVMAVRANDSNYILRNTLGQGGDWLRVKLQPTVSPTSAMGARVTVSTLDGNSQIRELSGGGSVGQDPTLLHFGLGANATIVSVSVRWAAGEDVTTLYGVDTNQTLVIDQDAPAPKRFDQPEEPKFVAGVHPNPFNPSTSIAFSIAEPSQVLVDIYSIDGRHVITLQNGIMPAGQHALVWNGRDGNNRQVGSGLYFSRIVAGEKISTHKMSLVK